MELLIVVTIIAMLAGMVLGALNSARETARKAKTRATIAKIDKHIMTKYESYRSRRLPLGRTELATLANGYHGSTNPLALARARMNAIRDLMRMEMPDRWNDIVDADGNLRDALFAYGSAGNKTPRPPSLARRYWSVYDMAAKQAGADRTIVEKWGPAECLYQIVMAIPEAAKDFQDNEIGDTDNDGLREFHDGWGRPIMFVRWPAGFLPNNGGDTELQAEDAPDPFDPRRIMSASGGSSYALYPLIYSAGPDGRYDVNNGKKKDNKDNFSGDPYYRYKLTPAPSNDLNPYVTDDDDEPHQIGFPLDADPEDGEENWRDNVHNHHFDLR